MPLTYSIPQSIATISSVSCVRIEILTPAVGDGAVTYTYEGYDAAGRVVQTKSYMEKISAIVVDSPADFITVRNILKTRAYSHIPKLGFPTGGVVT